jgi:cellulose synthase/poly-beta-1,6-N-acetylglucosamine synthase-like glycosyltransferase
MSMLAVILLSPLAAFLTAYVAYQVLLFAANAVIPDAAVVTPPTRRRFTILVPAHNEELHLPRLLASLEAQRYPKDSYRVTVVVDNCTDGTLDVCKRFDVDARERTTSGRSGKGHAIAWALTRIDLARFDAVVIVDADSLVDAAFLAALNLQMHRGDRVIQCYNGVANPEQSWFTRLMNVSRTISNEILHPGKRKLGLSSHLMGNGMCFDAAIFRSEGWNALSVGEDWEFYARLIVSGIDVGYCRRARVFHQESVDLRQASSQRLRWSGGRFLVLYRHVPSLLRAAIRSRRLKYLDAALPLVFPNPSLGMNLTLVGLVAAAAAWWLAGSTGPFLWFLALAVLQLLMFVIGVLYTEHKAASASSLVVAPIFLAWKMAIDLLSLAGVGRREWKATERRLS